ncbi:hypothetical protein HNP86_001876 [Methanococcus maripaludis]|uniref:Uncharacterized protein n=1 Tax=Methanococcus maripaludis TaxID=39152 RepID=A0A7J9NWL9_METMI|nr:hypothetical protein [Methanococcus maripaludis]MBA2851717.1 hypothetical protein [Methanococcus maripaludis]
MVIHNRTKQTPMVFDGHYIDALRISSEFNVNFSGDTAYISIRSLNDVEAYGESLYRYILSFTADYTDADYAYYDLTTIYESTELYGRTDIYCIDSEGNLLDSYIDVKNAMFYVNMKVNTGPNVFYLYYGSLEANIGTPITINDSGAIAGTLYLSDIPGIYDESAGLSDLDRTIGGTLV